MKKKLLLVLLPVVLTVAGTFAVWANEQSAPQPCCAKSAPVEKKAGCANCANAAKMEKAGCANCAKMKAAEGAPPTAGCDKCAKLQQPAQQQVESECCKKGLKAAAQPAEQPVRKGCCDKSKPL